jgi:hypothetical protein
MQVLIMCYVLLPNPYPLVASDAPLDAVETDFRFFGKGMLHSPCAWFAFLTRKACCVLPSADPSWWLPFHAFACCWRMSRQPQALRLPLRARVASRAHANVSRASPSHNCAS